MKSVLLTSTDLINQFWNLVDEEYANIDLVSFDLETNSVKEITADIYGIGLAFQDEEGFYIPVRAKDGSYFFDEATTKSNIDRVTKLLQTKKIIGHNLTYDTLVWYFRNGVRLYENIHADTILMKHCINEEPPFGLKENAVIYLGEWADKAQQALYDNIKANGGSITKTNLEMYKADTDVLGEYCTWDVMLTFKLYDVFSKKLKEENLEDLFYRDEVMPLYREVTIPMKERGVGVDTSLLETMLVQADQDAKLLTQEILSDIEDLIQPFCAEQLNKEFPVKKSGNFPKACANYLGYDITSMAKKVIQSLDADTEARTNFKQWMLGDVSELALDTQQIQLSMFYKKYPEDTHVFNLTSKTHLKWLFFDKLGLDPLSTTDKGEPQVDDKFLDSVANTHAWVNKLRDLNTIQKMKSTYIEGILERQVDGNLYTSFLQFGTTSGRFASRNPNLQNCPAPQNTGSIVDKYVNCVRKAIIARPGYKLIGSDFSSLEPHIAAFVSGDKDLIDIFVKDKDFYSAIAIKQFGMDSLSAYKDDPNYLGVVNKPLRDKTKTYSLAAFYGASGYRIAEVLGCSVEEASDLLNGYLEAFPGIKSFINKAHYDANRKGFVSTIFGRVRHLIEAKDLFKTYGHDLLNAKWAKMKGLSEERSKYKNLLNNSVNFQIQGTAGHVMNRAMLLTNRLLKEHGLDAQVVMTIHDEQIIEVAEAQAKEAMDIVKYAMENCVNLAPIKLKATPILGDSYGDCK